MDDALTTRASIIAARALPSSPTERRLRHEWELLESLVRLNPARLSDQAAWDSTFHVTLHGTPALPLAPGLPRLVSEHRLRLCFPRFFPAVPLELYLERPVRHPNIHPVSGFVCLWQSHRVEYTVEHALHRAVAILGWRLSNPDPRHVMQPEALSTSYAGSAQRLDAPALAGLNHCAAQFDATPAERRRRLS